MDVAAELRLRWPAAHEQAACGRTCEGVEGLGCLCLDEVRRPKSSLFACSGATIRSPSREGLQDGGKYLLHVLRFLSRYEEINRLQPSGQVHTEHTRDPANFLDV